MEIHIKPHGLVVFVTTITVDLEDWYHVCGVNTLADMTLYDSRVCESSIRVLDLFEELGIRTTWFVLGSVADAEPGLIKRIAGAGHEIASHGYSHQLVYDLTPAGFREEVVRTGEILAGITGRKVVGFRAPQWSLCPQRTPWAFDILASEGYLYDSSLTPLRWIGNPQGKRFPYQVATMSGTLWEIPPLVSTSMIGNLPTGGGWGLRFFPRKIIHRGVTSCHRHGNPAIFFIHPRELDPESPRLELSPLKGFVAYGPRGDTATVIRDMAKTGVSKPLCELVNEWQSVS